MQRFLAPHAYAADAGGDLVILDVRSDRYLCSPAGADLRLGEGRDALHTDDAELAAELAAAGLLAAAADGGPGRRPVRPRRDIPAGPAGLTGGDMAAAGVAVLDVQLAYAGRSLASLIETVRRRRAPPPDGPSDGLVRTVQAFRRWAPFTPLPAKCLLRSFMLLRALRRAGEDAVWVFGVTTRPFSAHCWLQVGDTVLDDHWERLARYEPIVAV